MLYPEPLWYWMTEREKIRQNRMAGIRPPFTQDVILQTFKFCNVFREHDRVTTWIRENIREPYDKHPNLFVMLGMARIYNLPETLQALIDGGPETWPVISRAFDSRAVTKLTQERKDQGRKIYTGAYMISAPSSPSNLWFGQSKQAYIAEGVVGGLFARRRDCPFRHSSDSPLPLEGAWSWMRTNKLLGWGPFMSYELVTDARWTSLLRCSPNIDSWANAGPGAIRGLRRLLREDGRLRGVPSPTVSRAEALPLMQRLLEEAPRNLPRWFPRLEMRDIQHSLCEVDKYLRVKHGEGRPRSMFHGAAWYGKEWSKA